MNENQNIHDPDYYVRTFTTHMPGIWKVLDSYIEARYTKNRNSFNKWCFLPVVAYADMFDKFWDKFNWNVWDHRDRLSVVLSACHPWRYTRQIYEIDDALFHELIQTPYDQIVPLDVLQKFPNFSFFIKTKIMSFFISMPDGACKENLNLAFVAFAPNKDAPTSVTWSEILLPLSKGKTVEQELSRLEELYKEKNHSDNNPYKFCIQHADLRQHMKRLINVVLYLCSTQPDIVDRTPSIKLHPFHVSRKSLKGKFKILPARKIKYFYVGENVGKVIRQHEESYSISRGKVRPHVRRAHWHGYWKGARDEQKEFILKWLPPTLVATNNDYNDTLLMGETNA